MKIKKSKTLKIIIAVLAILVIAGIIFLVFSKLNFARKAEISADLPKLIKVNQAITLPIIIDTTGETINAAEIYLKFDSQAIKVESVSKDNSFFELWITDEPKFSNEKGEISFAGGLPTPGFKGKGEIGQIIFIPKKSGWTEISFDSKTRALLNDGKGTAIPLS